MPQGAAAQYAVRGEHVNRVLAAYERALVDSGFEVRRRDPWGPAGWRCKAIWGSKATAVLVKGFVPFGSLMKSGKRLGAEAEIYQAGNDVVLRVAVVPYMELFDSPEMFLLSQGLFEKVTDDGFSREKLGEVVDRMAALGGSGLGEPGRDFRRSIFDPRTPLPGRGELRSWPPER